MKRTASQCHDMEFLASDQNDYIKMLRDENTHLKKQILDLIWERDILRERVVNEQSDFYDSISKEFV